MPVQDASAALADKHDIGDLLSKEAASQKEKNRTYLLRVLASVRFLARQGLPLRGDDDELESNLY